jgi:hypothetical protein
MGLSVAPALAQNRRMDEANDAAARRALNAAVRAAENPEPTRTATSQQPSQEQPAASQPAPAEPAAPEQPAAPAAPAQ